MCFISPAIASSSLDSSLCFWDAESGQRQHLLSFGPVDLWTVAFSPCDKYVISGSNEGKISMYNVESGKQEQILDPQNGKFTLSIAYVSLPIKSFMPLWAVLNKGRRTGH